MDQKQVLEILKANQTLRNRDEALRFLDAIRLLDPLDNSLLPDLLYLFHDQVEAIDALKYLDSFLARVDQIRFIGSLLRATPDLIGQAKGWLRLFFSGILYDSHERSILIEALNRLSDKERTPVIELLDEMYLEDLGDGDFNSQIRAGIRIVKSLLNEQLRPPNFE